MRSIKKPDNTGRFGGGMIIAAWILFLGLLTVVFGEFLDQKENPNQHVSSVISAQGTIEVVLDRNAYGHYVASGAINGQRVRFLVDTGATDVAIPASVAKRLNLKRGYESKSHTAGGIVSSYSTRINQVELGGIKMTQVRASIVPTMPGDDVLLGMSFLKNLEIIQRGDQLTLRSY